jgi:ribonuclease P protein subunit RPR2
VKVITVKAVVLPCMGRKELAEERIDILFTKAEEQFLNSRKDLADRYVELARKISQKSQIAISKEHQMRFCDECERYWMPGETCKVRLISEEGKILYECLECENQEKFNYKNQ